MGKWQVVFYKDSRGREPVRAWLEELEQRSPAEFGSVVHKIDLLGEFGVFLEEPHSRQLRGKLRELRAGPWRVTYFADPKRRFVLLTSFRKKGRRSDPQEIARARKPMKDWNARGGERGI